MFASTPSPTEVRIAIIVPPMNLLPPASCLLPVIHPVSRLACPDFHANLTHHYPLRPASWPVSRRGAAVLGLLPYAAAILHPLDSHANSRTPISRPDYRSHA